MKNDKEKFKEEFKRKIYQLIIDLIKFLDSLDDKDPVVRVAKGQLIRSGTSLGANYIEAQAASSRKDFTLFFFHALKSTNESLFWLALLRDSNRANRDKINEFISRFQEIAKILGSSIITLKNKR